MTHVISEEKAFEIVQEFLTDILQISQNILRCMLPNPLAATITDPQQSDIDTAVIVLDTDAVSQSVPAALQYEPRLSGTNAREPRSTYSAYLP